MGDFDGKAFFDTASQGGNTTEVGAAAFGVPSCLLDLAGEALSLLPTPLLNAINEIFDGPLKWAEDQIKKFVDFVRKLFGILVEYDEDGNVVSIFKWFAWGLSPFALLDIINRFVDGITRFVGELYGAYQSIMAEIEAIKDCIDSLRKSAEAGFKGIENNIRDLTTDEEYSNYVKATLDQKLAILDIAVAQKNRIINQKLKISKILADRRNNPNLEVCLGGKNNPEIQALLGNLGFKFCEDKVEAKEIFRLAYGPPMSKDGKFILSIDGLYYDSQTSGIEPALLELNRRKSNLNKKLNWKLSQDPSLGGRGKELTINDIKYYVNTILDDKIVDDSEMMKSFYSKDELLQNLIGQKNRRVFDVSSQLNEAIDADESDAIIENLKQVMISEASHNQNKINKRKKQIELAIKMPVLYKNESLFDGSDIPVNDFSYLEGINFQVDIDRQRKLVLNQQDVDSVVLPLEVKYTKQIESSDEIVFNHLLLSNIGLADIISDGSGVDAPKLSVYNVVADDSLVALYNLLAFEFSDTSSTKYSLNNSSDLSDSLNAQIVAGDTEKVFNNGVGIAYLEGITKNSSTTPTQPSSVGSYIRLPDTQEIQNLFYSKQGATFESWVHIPDFSAGEFDSNGVSSLYRLILANENTGLAENSQKQDNILLLSRDSTSDTTKGMIMGFTRDRRFTQNASPSNDTLDNPFSDACLVIAPTQSYDSSSVGFINKPSTECTLYQTPEASNSWFGITIPLSSTILSSVANQFCQITTTFEPSKNSIKVFCNGQLLAASSYYDCFGVNLPQQKLTLPTIKKPNSFEYNSLKMFGSTVEDLKYGPKLNRYFTPWIIGGGYTDGMSTGNFMGGEYGGISSGLNGFIGGIKLYSRPLSRDEVLNNYNSCKLFFENVKIVNSN